MEGLNKSVETITSKAAENEQVNFVDFEIAENFEGVSFNLVVKNVGEGDKEVISVFHEAVKSAIENGGQEMFRATKESNKDDCIQYLSAKPIAEYMKFLFRQEIFKKFPMTLKIKDSFNSETQEELN